MKHGGDLADAARHYEITDEDWLDLSTGINPEPYQFRPVSDAAWTRLPQSTALKRLLVAARKAYGAPAEACVLAAPGTQILLQLLPLIRPAERVAVIGPTYSEHAICWKQGGAAVSIVDGLDGIGDAPIAVIVNPNNPTGRIWPPDQLVEQARQIAERGGLLIVDEAFTDIAPEVSVAAHAGMEGLLVLRSFGKFFGLAGLRLGFALGPVSLVERLEPLLGPWAVSGPALEIGAAALNDEGWQQGARARAYQLSAVLDDMLASNGFRILGGTALFRLVSHPQAQTMHARLASHGIWVRRFEDRPEWLRFGLPLEDPEFERLDRALKEDVPPSE